MKTNIKNTQLHNHKYETSETDETKNIYTKQSSKFIHFYFVFVANPNGYDGGEQNLTNEMDNR